MATPNVVPRADQEGGLGTSAKSWGKLFIENPTDGGTAAATISNLDVDKIALDINANNTIANIIDITSTTLAGGKVMHVDIDDAGTTSHNNVVLNLDIDKSGVIASGQTVTTSGFILDINDAATNNASGTGVLYGIKSTLTNANATGTISQYGIQNTLSGGDTQWGIRNVCTGATAGTTTGFYQTVEDGGVDIRLNSSADTGDYFSIATTTHGATTITTLDDDAAAANLTFDIDGDIDFNADGGNVRFQDDTNTLFAFNMGSLPQLIIHDDADSGDYFMIQMNANGATEISTVDDDATAANLTFTVDGDVYINPAGLDIIVGDDNSSIYKIKKKAHSDGGGGGLLLEGGSATAGQTDNNGGSLFLCGGQSTGDAIPGQIAFRAANPAASTGSSLNSLNTIASIGVASTGDNATRFQMYEKGGASTADYLLIEVEEHGATTISTVDTAASAATLDFKTDGNINLAADSADYGKTISFGAGFHWVVAEVALTDANATDNGVIKQIPRVMIPQYSHIVEVSLTITELSNLADYNINLQISQQDGIGAGIVPVGLHELIGAGAGSSYWTDDIDAVTDVIMGAGGGNLKKNHWQDRANIINSVNSDGELTVDHYVYICSAGTGNGTTDATAGKVYVMIKYMGMD